MDVSEASIEKICKSIRRDKDHAVQLAGKLIKCKSVNPPGDYAAVASLVREELGRIGLSTETVEGAAGRINVVGKLKGEGNGKNLCLTSHTDVVPPGNLKNWKHDPFLGEVIGDVLWGRGAADSKGQLAAMISATRALIDSKMKLRGDVYLSAPVDDETAGSFGLRYLFSKQSIRADAIIFGEATGFGIAYTYKARMWFRITILGNGAHGAFPDKGTNSIEKAYTLIRAIKGLSLTSSPVLGRPTINVGTISGGLQPNLVPESCVCSFDVRWGPPLSAEEVKASIISLIKRLEKRDKTFRVDALEVTEIRDPFLLPKGMDIIRAIRQSGRLLLRKNLPLIGWYSSGDIYHVIKNGNAKEGVIFGPGIPWMAHAPNECIRVEDLGMGAELYAASAAAYCQQETN